MFRPTAAWTDAGVQQRPENGHELFLALNLDRVQDLEVARAELHHSVIRVFVAQDAFLPSIARRLHQARRQVDPRARKRILDAHALAARLPTEHLAGGDAYADIHGLVVLVIGQDACGQHRLDARERVDYLQAADDGTRFIVLVGVAGQPEGDQEARALVVANKARDRAIEVLHPLLHDPTDLARLGEIRHLARLRAKAVDLHEHRDELAVL